MVDDFIQCLEPIFTIFIELPGSYVQTPVKTLRLLADLVRSYFFHAVFKKKWQNYRFSGGSRISQMGGRQPQRGGAPTYYLTNFSQKLHENEENLTQRGGARPCAPPPRSANEVGTLLVLACCFRPPPCAPTIWEFQKTPHTEPTMCTHLSCNNHWHKRSRLYVLATPVFTVMDDSATDDQLIRVSPECRRKKPISDDEC